MRKSKLIAKFILLAFLFNTCTPLFAEEDTTPKKYDEKEFPQGLKDLRRFEIVTLGSLPFVTLDTTLAYSTIRYAQHNFDSAYQPDIFTKSNFTQDEQKQIIATSICISIGIGLTDYIVQQVKRRKKERQSIRTNEAVNITPISQDPDAVKIPLPEEVQSEDKLSEMPEEIAE